MISELINKVFEARNLAHLAHWNADSYSRHTALGYFYESSIEVVDALVESYIGIYGKPSFAKGISEGEEAPDIQQYLQDQADWIEANRDGICQGSTTLENLLDTLAATYTKTVYLLSLS